MLLRRQFWEIGLLYKLILLVFLSLLVFGEAEVEVRSRSLVVIGSHDDLSPSLHEKQLKRSLRHSFDALFSSKRKVPNAADPLHNR
ncbi:hypothetical protein CsatB_007520 [Cannabis sativa]|uniref:Uncharacterized protein n=1 Tax=Cannabis sativa TaxID=3483 RepID=A0A7J6ESE3_CANSA|nr:hypothetical protein G4B88_015781 [Cannabis sativa]